ncbi:MAG: Fe-S cluster assembly protein SufD [Acidimicrobiaceae bacterium]|nr:Fe-S cluster assembly protein SufD [Acidimicrobiaceae bacterium]
MTDFSTDAARALAGPAWLVERRVSAAEAFARKLPPDVADEEWRYSAIREFNLSDYAPSLKSCDSPALGLGMDEIDAAAVVHSLNGRVVSLEVADDLVAADVFIGPLADADAGSALLGAVSADASDYFTVLNDAFAAEPLLIRVPSDVMVERPIVVVHQVTGERVAAFPRLVVDVGANAQAEVLDCHTSDSGPLLVCPVAELDVSAAGRLGYLNVQQLGPATWQFSSQLSRAGRDASLTASTAAFGGGYARTRSDVRLVGRGANCDLLALYFGDGRQGLDFRTYQDHVAADTTSNLLYKGVVSDESRSIYTGLIRVRPDARGTNAFQTNRNLKLGENAWVESVPNLEIENNDVRCSHASAVGPVDAEQQFYLESRGVPTGEAERLIVAGFLDEVLESLPVTAMRQSLRSAIDAKLKRQARLSLQPQAEGALS